MNVNFHVTLHDKDGNEVEPSPCKCGKRADTFVQGRETIQWFCNECLYGKAPDVQLIYKPPKPGELRKMISELDENYLDPSKRGTPEWNERIMKRRTGLYKDKFGKDISLEEYCQISVDEDYKIIKQETCNDVWVSTVWLGIKHWCDAFFETMIFDVKKDDSLHMQRYSNLEQAQIGHEIIMAALREGYTLYPNNLEQIIQHVDGKINGKDEED